MSSDKNIRQYNAKGERHGYWEGYFYNGKLWFKCVYNNGIRIGYCEDYYYIGKLTEKIFYL